MRQHGIISTTFQHILLDAGQVRMNYVDSDNPGILIGATRGGNVFSIEPEYHSANVDGAKGAVKGDKRIIRMTARITVNIVEITPWIMFLGLPGSTTEEGPAEAPTQSQIKRSLRILLSDFNSTIAILGNISGTDEPAILSLDNPLADGGFEIGMLDNEESVLKIQFTGHYLPGDLNGEPWVVRKPWLVVPNFDIVYNGGNMFSFTNTSTGDYSESDWDFGDGSPHSTELNPEHQY